MEIWLLYSQPYFKVFWYFLMNTPIAALSFREVARVEPVCIKLHFQKSCIFLKIDFSYMVLKMIKLSFFSGINHTRVLLLH